MLRAKLTELKNFILANNPYLIVGYDNVHLDNTRGFVSDDDKIVFPNSGDYFYLRIEDEVKFDKASAYNLNDRHVAMGIKATVYLVAVMKKADPDSLLNNLISTIQQSPCSQKLNINFSGALYDGASVIERELKKTGEVNIKKALQNNDQTIVSVKFDVSMAFVPIRLSCIENPCATC